MRLSRKIILVYAVLIPAVFLPVGYYISETLHFAPDHAKGRIILAALLALAVSTGAGIYLSGSITRRIGEIVNASRDIAAGNLKRRLLILPDDEIGEIGRNLNIMAEEMANRMENLAREKEILETVFNTMHDGILVINSKGIITMASPAVSKILGLSEEITGHPLFEILRDPAVQDAVQEARNTGGSALMEIEIFHPANKHLYITATPFQSGILDTSFVVVIHDITQIKHLEMVRKDFVANVSHELRTPITAIKGFAETLLEGAIDDRDNARRYLGIIKDHSERLNSLVEDLLTLSRLDRGEVHLKVEEIDVRRIVDMVFLTLKEKAASKGLRLLNEVPGDFCPVVADRDRLTQILLNIVDNAIKFSNHGTVAVRGTTGDDIRITIEDTGIGIDAKDIPRLGERFYRVDRARSRAMGGTGLGLAIVKHLVQIHGWRMGIDSEVGKGTRVSLIIPRDTGASSSQKT